MTGGTASRYKLSGMASAGKTGTTSDNYDRYFVGYTPYYCAAVWCGYDNNERISYSGNPAASMWHKVMQKIADEQENKSFSKPTSGLTTVTVCADSGLLATDACAADLRGSRVRTVEVAAGTAPVESCNLHKLYSYCTEGKVLATEFCPATSKSWSLAYRRIRPSIVGATTAYLIGSSDGAGGRKIQLPPCPVHNRPALLPKWQREVRRCLLTREGTGTQASPPIRPRRTPITVPAALETAPAGRPPRRLPQPRPRNRPPLPETARRTGGTPFGTQGPEQSYENRRTAVRRFFSRRPEQDREANCLIGNETSCAYAAHGLSQKAELRRAL